MGLVEVYTPTTGVPSAAARCSGPESLLSSRLAARSFVASPVSVVAPLRSSTSPAGIAARRLAASERHRGLSAALPRTITRAFQALPARTETAGKRPTGPHLAGQLEPGCIASTGGAAVEPRVANP